MSSEKKHLRILCLGASLVYGYSGEGTIEHPFSQNLAKILRAALPDTDIDIVVDGVPGDLVTSGTFVKRMQSQFDKTPVPIDWTIVLGATNDIAYSVPIPKILEKLKQVWGIALSNGSQVLALTVPGATIDRVNEDLVARRDALNILIKVHKADGFHVFDLHDALPCDSVHAKFWDDAIHFTPDGYDLIGEKIAGVLLEIMSAKR